MMAEFAQTMRDWRRMCAEMQLMDDCADCPLINNVHVGEVTCIDGLTPADVVGISKIEQIVTAWAAEHPEPQYPTWGEWLSAQGVLSGSACYWEGKYMYSVNHDKFNAPIPADIAEKLGIEPMEDA